MHQICGLQCRTQANVAFGCRFSRSKWKGTKVIQGPKAKSSEPKKAKLLARKKEQISLSSYIDQFGTRYPIADFLSHPTGIESMLNTRALQRFEQLTPTTYRCSLQKIQLLNFEVAPILDLSVTPRSDDCIVEMLSCKFEGSETLEEQNKHFSAFLRNHIRWNETCPEPFLDVDVEVTVLLEVYTMPFVMLPISAIETPGNLIMQALVDRLVPLLLQQLIQDYQTWAEAQSRVPQKASSLSQYKALTKIGVTIADQMAWTTGDTWERTTPMFGHLLLLLCFVLGLVCMCVPHLVLSVIFLNLLYEHILMLCTKQ